MEAMVTVTDEKYFIGTQLLIYSFLKHHPNYQGEIVVIHDHLPQHYRDELSSLYAIRFEQVSERLQTKLEALVSALPHFKNKLQRFWSVELFRLTPYQKILFLDSDILCRGNLKSLLSHEQEFVACTDLSYYKNQFRVKESFELKNPSLEPKELPVFERTFNAGVMLVNRKEKNLDDYDQLLDLLNPHQFEKVTSGHTDQYVLNTHFEEGVCWAEPIYNYILREEELIVAKTGITSQQAILWHYIRHPKPWSFNRLLKNKLKGKASLPHNKEWHQEYTEFLRTQQSGRLNRKKRYQLFILRLLR